jgi:integrase
MAKRIVPDRRLSSFTSEELLGLIGGATLKKKAKGKALPLGQSCRKAIFELVKGAFRKAIADEKFTANPLEGYTPGQVPKKKRKLPTRDQIDKIVAAVIDEYPRSGKRAALTIRFLAFSGLRRSEAASLMWPAVSEGEIEIDGTKTEGADRTLQIGPALQGVMDEITAVYGKTGRVVPLKCVRGHLKLACAKLGLQKLTNHDLRAWFVTYALQQGADVPTVADWIGDSPTVVLSRYTSIMDGHKKTAAKLLK